MFFKNGNTCWPLQNTCIPEVSQYIYIYNKTIQTHYDYTPSQHIKHDIVFLMILILFNEFEKAATDKQNLKHCLIIFHCYFYHSHTEHARAYVFCFFLPDIVNNMTNGQFTCTSIWRHLSAINITLGQHNYFLKSRLLLINHDNFFVISTNSHF